VKHTAPVRLFLFLIITAIFLTACFALQKEQATALPTSTPIPSAEV